MQDYRLWASWSPYDGPKSFLLGRAESISLQRTWSPCTVNGPSSSHCKGPEVLPAGKGWVHPTLMGLRELFIVWGPFNWKGLSSSQHNGPDGNIVGYGGSSCIKRLKCIGVQGTWYGHFKLSLSQLKGLAKTLGSFNPIWTGLFWLNLGTLEILKFSFFIKELSTLAFIDVLIWG